MAAILTAGALALCAHGGIALAQTPKPDAKAQAPVDPKEAKAAAIAAAQKAYVSGTKAFEAGKFKDSIPQLTTALGGGGLPSQQMAKALYYRGVANRKLGKPAQAMSDLTTAIWVNGGLSDAERAQAIENRQAAYREAGLGDQAPPEITQEAVASPPQPVPAVAAPVAAVTAPPPASAAPVAPPVVSAPFPVPEAPPVVVAAQTPPAFDVYQPSVAQSPVAEAVATSPPKPARVESTGIPSPFDDPGSARILPTPAAAAPQAPEPAPTVAQSAEPSMMDKAGKSISDAGSNVGNFFSNMFGGNSSKQEPAPPPPAVVMAQTPADSQTSSSAVLTAANPDGAADAGWGDSTEVKTAKGKKVAAVAPPPPPPVGSPVSTAAISPAAAAPVPLPAPKALSGKYLLQVGAVRARADAEAIAQKVRDQHGATLGGRKPAIDEAVIGNFGSFHRVRVGPYADAKEPGRLCSSLIKAGFDCLVVTQ